MKKYQKGNATVVGFAFLAVILILCFWIYGVVKTAGSMENRIEAAHEAGISTLGQHAPKIKEIMGVKQFDVDALAKLISTSNESRYGSEGSKATMQFIQEQNPQLDQSTTKSVMAMIEASRNDFNNAQKTKVDLVRAYKDYAGKGNPLNAFILKFFDMPSKVDKDGKSYEFFDYYGKVIASTHARTAESTGIDDGVDINKK